jgi:hypothetical protein
MGKIAKRLTNKVIGYRLDDQYFISVMTTGICLCHHIQKVLELIQFLFAGYH